MAQLESPRASLEFADPAAGHLLVALGRQYDTATVGELEPQLEELLSRGAGRRRRPGGNELHGQLGGAILLRIVNHFGPVEVAYASPMICRMIHGLGLSVLRMPPG
jgi:hypothetical protein